MDELTGERFERFWAAYPNKTAKGYARKIFERISPDDALLNRMIFTLSWQSKSKKWTQDNGEWIPNPSTWLNQERWEDVPLNVSAILSAKDLPYQNPINAEETAANQRRVNEAVRHLAILKGMG